MTATREAVAVAVEDLHVGDRFADGWAVMQRPHAAHSRVLVSVGKRNHARRLLPYAPQRVVTVSRAVKDRYVRQERVNRETGTTILVLDLDAPGSTLDRDGDNRWATVCNDHSWIVSHPTLELAIGHASNPTGWCERCAGTEPEEADCGCMVEDPHDGLGPRVVTHSVACPQRPENDR